jgi:shikimate dehydrogenase
MTFQVGLIGKSIEHSLSPSLQNAAFSEIGFDAIYTLWPTHADELKTRVAALRAPEVLGANVTSPYKLDVIPFLDELDISAKRIGAVNTIVRHQKKLIGYNTDAQGLEAAIRETGLTNIKTGLILGAGGAARAATMALIELGCAKIGVAARRAIEAKRLATAFTAFVPNGQIEGLMSPQNTYMSQTFRSYLLSANVIINATPIGGELTPGFPLSTPMLYQIAQETLIVDLITRDTPMLATARTTGRKGINGLSMLVHQGALAFTLWTQKAAPLAIMKRAVGLE